jgi:hypothetical protein
LYQYKTKVQDVELHEEFIHHITHEDMPKDKQLWACVKAATANPSTLTKNCWGLNVKQHWVPELSSFQGR